MTPGVTAPGSLLYNIIVSRGDVRSGNMLSYTIVYANGTVTVAESVSHAVIVCDGDVTVGKGGSSDVLVIARGSIDVKGLTTSSTLIAGGKIKLENWTVKPKFLVPLVKEDEPNAFGFVTFFELSTVGVEVKVAEGAVRVSSVGAEKAFAQAGVRKDDVITEVGGKKPDSAESLRRLLRDALALGDATVTLKRGDKIEAVKVALPE